MVEQPNLPHFDESIGEAICKREEWFARVNQSEITEYERQAYLARMFAKFKHYKEKAKDKTLAKKYEAQAMRCIKLMEKER